MPEPWEPEKGNDSWSDRDAWRGDAHAGDDETWRAEAESETEEVWAIEEELEAEAETDDITLEDWPENLAGPEYWLYKRYGM